MTDWVQPVTLTGRYVRLEPMTVVHTAALAEIICALYDIGRQVLCGHIG